MILQSRPLVSSKSHAPAALRAIVCAGLLVLVAVAPAVAHPFHVTISEAEYNPRTDHLEVALRVKPVDLEEALQARFRKKVKLEKDKRADALIAKYLESVFVVRDAAGKPIPLKWVGKEVEIQRVWLYFEFPLKGKLAGAVLDNRVFLEILPDQINTVTFRRGRAQRTLHFTRRKMKRPIAFTRPERKSPAAQ